MNNDVEDNRKIFNHPLILIFTLFKYLYRDIFIEHLFIYSSPFIISIISLTHSQFILSWSSRIVLKQDNKRLHLPYSHTLQNFIIITLSNAWEQADSILYNDTEDYPEVLAIMIKLFTVCIITGLNYLKFMYYVRTTDLISTKLLVLIEECFSKTTILVYSSFHEF